ncbi:BgTH12-01704 [Blumeria graminis f. sp. triticale]|uniref:BgtE-5991 n=3 Tax=Blumeria graminis TaxID=34373 RepID=A0A061HGT1_BLUGR|nr:putative secreted effector protein [Blumeria graminis f. sp. tritici 96224]CAD6501452.1 BgTH12-01704 [Blumeria graminis f. sp. triticale]VDB83947.1 BgtE-5991 [Blumeria graminis f. sp. tritici]
MQLIRLLVLAFAAFVAASPYSTLSHTEGGKGGKGGKGDDDGDDDGPQTCNDALQTLPKCALQCVIQPPIDAGCKSAADFSCTCEHDTNKAITKQETPCVLDHCSLQDSIGALKAGRLICDLCNVPSNDTDSYN